MKSSSQIAESIERFRSVFWDKDSKNRPPVGIVPSDIFLPIKYLQKPFTRQQLLPEEVHGLSIPTDYEFGFADSPISCDDFIPFTAAWRAIPWLEAICGCSVKYATGSLAAGSFAASADQLTEADIPANNEWLNCLRKETERLTSAVPADCFISPTILRGPSDVIAAMRGLTEFYCDIATEPKAIEKAAERVNKLLLDILDMHFSIVQTKLKGFGHIYGYWAPGKTIVIQEDVLGMCSPDTYHNIFMKYNADIVNHLGGCVFFHLHSTGLAHYKNVLKIPNIAGLQITIESNGPDLLDLLPVLKETLENSRLILYVDHFFDQLAKVLAQIPHQGLYLVIPNKFIKTEKQFSEFLKDCL